MNAFIFEARASPCQARTNGTNPVPESRLHRGYRYRHDKFGVAGSTPAKSETVGAPRVLEYPVQLESTFPLAERDPKRHGRSLAMLVRIERVRQGGARAHRRDAGPAGFRISPTGATGHELLAG